MKTCDQLIGTNSAHRAMHCFANVAYQLALKICSCNMRQWQVIQSNCQDGMMRCCGVGTLKYSAIGDQVDPSQQKHTVAIGGLEKPSRAAQNPLCLRRIFEAPR